MERIYFDKQIFSYLFKGDKPVYQKLYNDLLKNKDHFIFCYSHGHLLDLKNDKSEIKFSELDFIETIVDDNYLSYHATENRTSCYLAKPREAFGDIEDDTEIAFATMFDNLDLELVTPEQKEQIKLAKDLFTNEKIDFGFLQIQDLPDDIKNPLSKILPVGLGPMTLLEWTEHFMGMLKSMENDKSVYKGLRNVVDKHINNGKFTIDINEIDFNDDLKNSALQKTFIEYVNSNLNPNGDKEITNYDFYTNAYFTLDLLGISKEPSKKVKFGSVLNDGYHSYYGAFCDYVVSDDQGFLKKTKALYRLLGIETKVYHIDEFIPLFYLMSNSIENSPKMFFDLLINDIKNGLVTENYQSIKYNRHTTIIKPFHSYFGYFNQIESIKEDNQDYILLRRKTKNYSNFSFFRQYQGIINKAFKIFSYDLDNKGEFDWDREIEEIKSGTWKGRFWDFETFTILIEINIGIKEICLLLTPKKLRE